jgi:ribonuclease BN (tRNA processing enzyme)
MIVRCYGARGSIPVSGEEYLKYGGDSTCIEIRTKNDEIVIVDAGSGIRRLGNRLMREERFNYTVFFTHSHWDHILGFPFFKPLFHEKTTIDLKGCPNAQGNVKKLLSKAMSAPLFPIPFDNFRAAINYDGTCPRAFNIDSIEVSTINLSHPNTGLGYRFVEDGKIFVFLTDNELGYRHKGGRTFEEYAEFSRNADLLIHDAEYTPEQYKATIAWGHSTYADALNLALAAGVKRLGLFHHNQDRKDEEQDEIVRKCREIIESQKAPVECFALTQTTELTL